MSVGRNFAVGAALVALMGLVAGCGATTGRARDRSQEVPVVGARPCRATDLAAAEGIRNGAGGTTMTPIVFRNRSSSPCVLSGYPAVTATRAGDRPVTARHAPGSWVRPAMDLAPGQRATVVLLTFAECASHPGGGDPVWYSTVMVGLPSGGVLAVPMGAHELDVTCGLSESTFGSQPGS